jgi:hypothetical protein
MAHRPPDLGMQGYAGLDLHQPRDVVIASRLPSIAKSRRKPGSSCRPECAPTTQPTFAATVLKPFCFCYCSICLFLLRCCLNLPRTVATAISVTVISTSALGILEISRRILLFLHQPSTMSTEPSSDMDMPSSPLPESIPTSPPSVEDPSEDSEDVVDKRLAAEEERARLANNAAAAKKKKGRGRKPRKAMTQAELDAKVKDLEELLSQCEQFRLSLTKKSDTFAGLEGKTLGEHSLKMAKQPKCVVGGKMRDYQLEGLTWMYQVCEQGLSGILADEMGLGELIVHHTLGCSMEILTSGYRQDMSDNFPDRAAARARVVLRPSSDCRPAQHPVQLGQRVQLLDPFHPGGYVSWNSQGT